MAGPTATLDEDPPAGDDPGVRPRRSIGATVARAVVVVIVLGSLLLWIYAFSGVAERDPPNLLHDPAFSEAAEPICAAALVELEDLPRAENTPEASVRADVIDESNVILTAMVADLSQLDRGDARDTEMLTEWLGDWEVYIGDRAGFAERLRADEMARFYVTEKQPSFQITKAIDDLANVNAMPSCATTTDVG